MMHGELGPELADAPPVHVHEPAIGVGLLDRLEILAQRVLDELDGQQLVGVEFPSATTQERVASPAIRAALHRRSPQMTT
jgi:hypothetical protein